MPKLTIELSEDLIDILTDAFAQMHSPSHELTLEEMLAVSIDAIVMSFDSQQHPAGLSESAPISRDALLAAITAAESVDSTIQRILSPNISMDYVAPVGDAATVKGEGILTFQQVQDMAPENSLVLEALETDANSLMRTAICLVFSNISREQWDQEYIKPIVHRTIGMIKDSSHD